MSKEEVEAKEQIFSFVKENEEEVKIVERDRFRVIKKASMQIRGSRIPGFFKSDMLFCKVKFPNFQFYQFFLPISFLFNHESKYFFFYFCFYWKIISLFNWNISESCFRNEKHVFLFYKSIGIFRNCMKTEL